MEGLDIALPAVDRGVGVSIAVGVLLAPFVLQPAGKARIGAPFGPMMPGWLATLGALGPHGIAAAP